MKNINGRFIFVTALLGLAALTLFVRYAILMLGGNPPPQAQSRRLAERGPILDRNGRFLALQTRLANISVWRPDIDDVEELAAELSPMLEMPAQEIAGRITGAPSDFVYLKRQVDESAVKMINSARAEGKIRGVGVEPIVWRIYPEKTLASQIIGFVGREQRPCGNRIRL